MRLQIALIALAVASPVASASPSGNKLSIAGVSPGDTLETIVATLGHPVAQEPSDGFIALQVRFDGLSFDLDEDGLVANAETTNPAYCFNGWLCPGASLPRVQSRLAGLTRPASHDEPFVAFADGDGCWLEITAPTQKITALAFKCAP